MGSVGSAMRGAPQHASYQRTRPACRHYDWPRLQRAARHHAAPAAQALAAPSRFPCPCRVPLRLLPLQNSLLVAAAIQPFITYAADLPKSGDDGQAPWQDLTLASFWAVVLVINSAGLAVTIVQLVRSGGGHGWQRLWLCQGST